MTGQDDNIDERRPLESILEIARNADSAKIGLGDILERLGSRSFGPLLILFGLFALVPPISGIPGVPSVMGLLSILVAVQMAVGKDHLWLPTLVLERELSADKVGKFVDKAMGFARRIDKIVGRRLEWAIGPTGGRIAGLCVCLAGCTMIPLELLPFAAALPAAAIVLFGLAIVARDGLVALFGFALFAAACALLARYYLFSGS